MSLNTIVPLGPSNTITWYSAPRNSWNFFNSSRLHGPSATPSSWCNFPALHTTTLHDILILRVLIHSGFEGHYCTSTTQFIPVLDLNNATSFLQQLFIRHPPRITLLPTILSTTSRTFNKRHLYMKFTLVGIQILSWIQLFRQFLQPLSRPLVIIKPIC